MIFNKDTGYFVSDDYETINVFCSKLVDEANTQSIRVFGKYDDVILMAKPFDSPNTLIAVYNEAIDAIRDRELKKNGEGYEDPTAYEAIVNVEKHTPYNRTKTYDSDRDRHFKLLGCIFRICELSGFTVEERIVLKDNKTGKIWR